MSQVPKAQSLSKWGDDGAQVFADAFAVQGEVRGQPLGPEPAGALSAAEWAEGRAAVFAQPGAEHARESFEVQAREQEAEGFVAGDFRARAAAAAAQAELAALGLGEARGGAQDGVEVVGPAEQAHAHAAEHGGQGMEAVAAARVGHGAQREQQRAQLARGHGQRCAFARRLCRGVPGGECGGAEPRARVGPERFDPEFFRPLVGRVKFRALAAVALGEAQRRPARGLVTGARVAL